jgi:hypothetical protein
VSDVLHEAVRSRRGRFTAFCAGLIFGMLVGVPVGIALAVWR